MNHTTRKFPRTLNEAFGPAAKGIHEEPRRSPDFWVGIATAIAFAALVVLLLTGDLFHDRRSVLSGDSDHHVQTQHGEGVTQ